MHQDSEVLVSITIDEVDESDDRGDTKVTHREDKGRLIILINLFKTPEDQLDNLAQTLLHEGTLHAFAAWERFQDVKKGTLKSKDAFPTNKKQLVAQEDHEHRDEQKWALVLKASQGSRVEYEQTLFEIMTHIPKTELGIFAVNEIVRLNPENKDNSGSEEEDEK